MCYVGVQVSMYVNVCACVRLRLAVRVTQRFMCTRVCIYVCMHMNNVDVRG
jgi:hypothetical protein